MKCLAARKIAQTTLLNPNPPFKKKKVCVWVQGGSTQTAEMLVTDAKVMTFAVSKCVHNLTQTSILLGKLIATAGTKKISAAPQGLRQPLCRPSPNNSLHNWLTTRPGTLFHTLATIPFTYLSSGHRYRSNRRCCGKSCTLIRGYQVEKTSRP